MENFLDVIYRIIKPILFKIDAETSHHLVMNIARALPFLLHRKTLQMPVRVCGLNFSNPVGLAAGFDKNAEYLDVLSQMGFGFIEVGSVTPVAQVGNPKPRLKRLIQDSALLNHMGLNNVGVEQVARNLENRPQNLIIGASFTKNTSTTHENAIDDYIFCFQQLHRVADYLVADVSCPNTNDFENNSKLEFLDELCAKLKESNRSVPLFLKLSCDWQSDILVSLSRSLLTHKIDGVICGNTSKGLSGPPLFPKALQLVSTMNQLLQGNIPIIASGGISTAQDFRLMKQAGAELIQIYTALIYKGPGIISQLLK